MLERSIQELKRLTLTEGTFSGLNFFQWSLDRYMFSHIIQRLVYRRMNGYVIKKLNNSSVRMILNANDRGISQELMYRGTHEPLSTKILLENVHEGMRIVDIGANLGYFALQEAKAVGPKGIVYAIEPVPSNWFLLKQNVALNELGNVEVYNLAIGDKDGVLDMFMSGGSNWGSALRTTLNSDRKITVHCQRLDTLLKDKGKVDLVRMDVEGYESNVVDGMTETLKQKELMLFIELHPLFARKRCEAVLRKLDDYGFVPFAIVGNYDASLVKDVKTIGDLLRNTYLMGTIFHGFFRN
jgi:FkbM family methyltransferase